MFSCCCQRLAAIQETNYSRSDLQAEIPPGEANESLHIKLTERYTGRQPDVQELISGQAFEESNHPGRLYVVKVVNILSSAPARGLNYFRNAERDSLPFLLPVLDQNPSLLTSSQTSTSRNVDGQRNVSISAAHCAHTVKFYLWRSLMYIFTPLVW